MTYRPHPESMGVTIDTYGVPQETLQRYIAGQERKLLALQNEARTIQYRLHVRTIESALCDNMEFEDDEQLNALQRGKLAYVGTLGDRLDDDKALRELNEQIEALIVLIAGSKRLGGTEDD